MTASCDNVNCRRYSRNAFLSSRDKRISRLVAIPIHMKSLHFSQKWNCAHIKNVLRFYKQRQCFVTNLVDIQAIMHSNIDKNLFVYVYHQFQCLTCADQTLEEGYCLIMQVGGGIVKLSVSWVGLFQLCHLVFTLLNWQSEQSRLWKVQIVQMTTC